MPRLIVLNGPPACGKSTLARRYAREHPLTLDLDVDRIRDQIGGWRDDPHAAGLLARAISLAAAEVHLRAGHDVIVPQYLGRPAFLDQLADLAGRTGADLHEIVLMDSKPGALRRFTARAGSTGDAAHHDAADQLARAGGLAELSAMYDRLHDVIASRPRTVVIDNPEGGADAAYRRLVDAVA